MQGTNHVAFPDGGLSFPASAIDARIAMAKQVALGEEAFLVCC